jgi:hypothetical protein
MYIDIVLFRRGPEDLPASSTLLWLTIAINVLLGLLLGSLIPLPGGNRVAMALAEAAFVLAWYWALMRIAGRPERFLQTSSAIFGFQTILLPAFMVATWLYLSQQKADQLQLPVVFFIVALAVWTLAVNSRIVRAATEWPLFACVVLVLLQALVGQVVILGLFPDAVVKVSAGPAAG